MNSDDRKRLVRKRAVARGTVTRLKNFIDKFQEGEDLNLIRVRLDQLSTVWEQFTDAQTELEVDDTDHDHTPDRDDFEQEFHLVKAKMLTLLETPTHDTQSVQSQAHRNIKLPTIGVPKFDGSVTEFTHYRDVFTSLIINNETLDDMQRFHYLLSSLTGEAHRLIDTLPITNNNFAVAWRLICERYNCPKLIAHAHVKGLLNLASVTKESPINLRAMLNQLRSNLSAIEALDLQVPLHEVLLSQIVLDRVDETTRREWEIESSVKEIPKLETLITFVERRCQALEAIKPSNDLKPKKTESQRNTDRTQYSDKKVRASYMSTNHSCCICNNEHQLNKCPMFTQANVQRRVEVVKQNNLCFNCLKTGHTVKGCPAGNCKLCDRKHNTLLHRDRAHAPVSTPITSGYQPQQQGANNNFPATRPDSASSYHTMKVQPTPQVLLATALVKVKNSQGQWQMCRALLDSGSQSNFVSESLVQILKLKRVRNTLSVQGINNTVSEAKHSVNVELSSTATNYRCAINCFVVPKISGELPATYINPRIWNIPSNVQLADPRFNIPDRVDVLIGAELFFHLLLPDRAVRHGTYPVLQNTELGWILSGRFQERNAAKTADHSQTFFVHQSSVEQQLQRFWEIEELDQPPRSREEAECERHFCENTVRDDTGRFVVRLPFRQGAAQLGHSRDIARTRFIQLERRLSQNSNLRNQYTAFLDEYEGLGHMQRVKSTDVSTAHYLPHHPVFKESSTTTKMRVVFDASAKSSNDKSLNDILLVGPTIQQDLFSIVLRFRTHRFCFTADIEKMYRQIKVDPRDTPFQRILWRRSPSETLHEFELKTVTYGTAAAPFLATRCLKQLALEEEPNYPKATNVLQRDFYVDDCISGAHTLQEALQLQKQLIHVLNKGGFTLRKWSSNHESLLEAIPEEHRETNFPLQLDDTENIKTLGLLWHPATDKLQITSSLKGIPTAQMSRHGWTKRRVLAAIASIFDPLGLVSSIVISCKIFLQHLWQAGATWDAPLTEEMCIQWKDLFSQIPIVNQIYVDRLVLVHGEIQTVELHGFSDASERAYGACIYLRSTDNLGHVAIKLLCSKSKVAPVKKISLPRLELCAALLLARLCKRAVSALELEITHTYLWTDSTIVLAWLKAPSSKWKTFVANRVSEIQEATNEDNWRHVASQENPADLISRGVNPSQLINSPLWFEGPSWLKRSSLQWPEQDKTRSVAVPEQRQDKSLTRNKASCLSTHCITSNVSQRFSTLIRLQRVIAYCIRFYNNARVDKSNRQTGVLSGAELQHALLVCIKVTQAADYKEEINMLQTSRPIDKHSKLKTLSPFLCEQQLLRVGGRLENAELTYDQRHQLILHPQSHLTRLIIEHEHKRLLHAGALLLLSSLRQRYWIINARSVIRQVLHKCVTCHRFRAKPAQQQMGQLPAPRVRPTRPFLHTGIDYAGPIHIKAGNRRSKTVTKAYIALFVCMATKAVHIEIVSDLTSQAYLAALKRFISRRGRPSRLYSDNATNFVGANRELQQLHKMLIEQNNQLKINQYCDQEGIEWSFIPPKNPHHGGIWEAGVKSLKYHLRRVMGSSTFTFEEGCTLLALIEGCLNSRPLTVLSSDPNDPTVLTPGHFLIGAPLMSYPEPDLTHLKPNLLGRWQRLQQQLQGFWLRWSKDYLHHLQQRGKWTDKSVNIQPGTVVLIKEDNATPLQWHKGIIVQTHPGNDGLVRVATVRTTAGTFKRSITRLCPLPNQGADNEDI